MSLTTPARQRSGFILAEVAIAISIAAIMAGVLAPKVNDYFIMKRIERTALTFQYIAEAARMYMADNPSVPPKWPATVAVLQAGNYLPAGSFTTGWGGAITMGPAGGVDTAPLFNISADLPVNFTHSLDGYLPLITVTGSTTTMAIPKPEAVPLTASFLPLAGGTMTGGSTLTAQTLTVNTQVNVGTTANTQTTIAPTTGIITAGIKINPSTANGVNASPMFLISPTVATGHANPMMTLRDTSSSDINFNVLTSSFVRSDLVTWDNYRFLKLTSGSAGASDISSDTTKYLIFDPQHGRIGINGVPTDFQLQVVGSISATANVEANKVIFNSDATLKNIDSQLSNVMPRLHKLNGYRYAFKNDPNVMNLGVIAQEVREQFPDLVSVRPTGTLGVDYAGFAPVFIEAIKELDDSVGDLRKLVKLDGERLVLSDGEGTRLASLSVKGTPDTTVTGKLSVKDVYLSDAKRWAGSGLAVHPDDQTLWLPGAGELDRTALGDEALKGIMLEVSGPAGSSALITCGSRSWRVTPGQWTLFTDATQPFEVNQSGISVIKLVAWLG